MHWVTLKFVKVGSLAAIASYAFPKVRRPPMTSSSHPTQPLSLFHLICAGCQSTRTPPKSEPALAKADTSVEQPRMPYRVDEKPRKRYLKDKITKQK